MRQNKTTNIVLILIAMLTVIFIAIMIWLFYLYQSIPETLCQCFFASVVGELGVTGWIKVIKTKYKDIKGNE